jgi:hypothetical protein
MSPIIDSYGAINEPHAHPFGLMSLLNNSNLQNGLAFQTNTSSGMIQNSTVDGSSAGDLLNFQAANRNPRKNNLAGVMKLDRVFPININYLNSDHSLEASMVDLHKNNHTTFNLMPAAGNVSAHLMTAGGSEVSVVNDSAAGTNATFPTNAKKQGRLTSIPGYYDGAQLKQNLHKNKVLNGKNPNIFASGQQSIQRLEPQVITEELEKSLSKNNRGRM